MVCCICLLTLWTNVSIESNSLDLDQTAPVGSEYSRTCLKRPHSKRPQIGFQDQLTLNAGQKYCKMLPGEHSAILSTFIKLPFVIKIFILSIFEWLSVFKLAVHCLTKWLLKSISRCHKETAFVVIGALRVRIVVTVTFLSSHRSS